MTEFDPAMVERLCIASLGEDGIEWPTLAEWIKNLHRERMRNTLTALRIPAAALNALEAGDAVVVKRRALTEAGNVMFNLRQRNVGRSLTESDLKSLQEASRNLDAALYAKEMKDG